MHLFFIPGMNQASQPLLAFLVSILVNSFFHTWAHNGTGGSILMAILLHDTFNATTAFIPMFPMDWEVIGVTLVSVAAMLAAGRQAWFASPRRTSALVRKIA